MSAAFPDVTPQYSSVSPQLAETVNENLYYFSKLTKTVVELTQKVASIHDEAAVSLLSTVDVFNKRVTEITKNKHCQNESFVKFIHRLFEQMEYQAKTLQSLGSSFSDCVVAPLQEVVEKKKEVWKTCFHYVHTFQEQIRKKEDDLVKRHKDYSDAALKIKTATETKPKQLLFFNNSHNTYLLRLSSVNSINNLLYTHVLPYVLHSLEKNQGELNDSLRHHIKYMFSVQKDALKKLSKSVDKIDHASDKIDIVSDIRKFIKITKKAGLKDDIPPKQELSLVRSDQNRRASVLVEPGEEAFIVNKLTQPNLQRRLASLQYQTNQLVDSIATMRAGESQDVDKYIRSDDISLNEVIELLCICDKEANLNVLLKQMELYTPSVLDYLGPAPDNLILESRHTKKSPTHQPANDSRPLDGQQPHEFTESRLMKPMVCYYCSRMISLIGKGFTCKVCKMSVHRKCVTNAPFCDGTPIKQKSRTKSIADGDNVSLSSVKPESSIVYDLIDFEDDDYDYFDEDEFDDGLSDDEIGTTSEEPYCPHYNTSKPAILKPSVISKKTSLPPFKKPLPKEPINDHSNRRHTVPVFPAQPIIQSKQFSKEMELPPKPSIAKKPTIATKPVVVKSALPQIPPRNFCVALYNYQPTLSTDLGLTAGCKIELLEQTDSDWWKGQLSGNSGFFPSQYVMKIQQKDIILRSLYEFHAESDKEISTEEGQILVLIKQEDDWYDVKTFNGKGLVPTSYVEHI